MTAKEQMNDKRCQKYEDAPRIAGSSSSVPHLLEVLVTRWPRMSQLHVIVCCGQAHSVTVQCEAAICHARLNGIASHLRQCPVFLLPCI